MVMCKLIKDSVQELTRNNVKLSSLIEIGFKLRIFNIMLNSKIFSQLWIQTTKHSKT